MEQNRLISIEPTFTKGKTVIDRMRILMEFWPDCPKEIKDILTHSSFLADPASTKYHGNYPGGLFDHSMNVAKILRYLTNAGICNEWTREHSPEIIGILHDYTKVGAYTWDKVGYVWRNRVDFGGHGSDSVIKLQQIMKITDQEAMCIRYHMGAYEKDDWDNYGGAIQLDPNVLWTHAADMYASRRLEVRV